jgi:hypothetical protein
MFTASLAFAQSGAGNSGETVKPHAFLIQDNEFRWYWGPYFRDPFIENSNYTQPGAYASCSASNPAYLCPAKNIMKNVIHFVHVDLGNKLGDNLFSMQYLMDNRANPVSVPFFHDNPNVGSKDVYMSYRHDIVLDRLVNKDLGVGPIKNWILTVGADFGSKNDDFANQRRSPMIGPGVNFKVPNGGYLKVNAMWTREWNEEGTDVTSWYYTNPSTGLSSIDSPIACYGSEVCVPSPHTWGQKVVYSPREVTFQAGWGVPFALGKMPWIFEGFSTLNTAKGYGAAQLLPFTGSGFFSSPVYYHAGTRPEWISDGLLLYNFGSLFGSGHNWQIGPGYEYWHNMFGVGQNAPGVPNATYECNACIENSIFTTVAIHF